MTSTSLSDEEINSLVSETKNAPTLIAKTLANGVGAVNSLLARLESASAQLNAQLVRMVAASHEELLHNAAAIGAIPDILENATAEITALCNEINEVRESYMSKEEALRVEVENWQEVVEGLGLLHQSSQLMTYLNLIKQVEADDFEADIAKAKLLQKVVDFVTDEETRAKLTAIDCLKEPMELLSREYQDLQSRARKHCRNFLLSSG